jgi:Terminase small subunit
MPVLLSPRHEQFAQGIASGMSACQAYRLAGYKETSAEKNSARLKENDGIASRIAEIRTENNERNKISRDEVFEFLAAVIRTGAGDVGPSDKLCQSYKVGDGWSEVKVPDKLAAVGQLARMCGWNEPDRLELSIDPLQSLLDSIRSRVEPRVANSVRPAIDYAGARS